MERVKPNGTIYGSMHEEYKPELCGLNHGYMRCILCDNSEYDIVECVRCGYQQRIRCTFDDDYD